MLKKLALSLSTICFITTPGYGAETQVDGKMEIMYRNVSTDGNSDRYREDVNQHTGGSISEFWLDIDSPDSPLVDTLSFDVNNFGDTDPYENYRIKAAKHDTYDFSFNYRVFDHYYELPARDYHYFDTSRELGDVDLKLYPSDILTVHFGYKDNQKEGMNRSTKDAYETREEFGFWIPQDVTDQKYNAGFSWNIGENFDIYFDQAFKDYEMDADWDLEGEGTEKVSEGFDETDDANLSYYNWVEESDIDSAPITTVRAHGTFFDRVDATVSYIRSDMELDSSVNMTMGGLDYTGTDFTASKTSRAEIDHERDLLDLNISALITDWLVFHGQYRTMDSDREGFLDKETLNSVEDNGIDEDNSYIESLDSKYEIDTLAGYFDVTPLDNLRFKAGYKTKDRDYTVDYDVNREDSKELDTDDDSWILGFNWKPVSGLTLSGDYESADYDEALVRMESLEADNLRLKAVLSTLDNYKLTAFYRNRENKNNDTGFDSETDSAGLKFWHQPLETFNYGLSYTIQEIDWQLVRNEFTAAPEAEGGATIVGEGTSEFTEDRDIYSFNCNWAPTPKLDFMFDYSLSQSEGTDSFITDLLSYRHDIGQDYQKISVEGEYTFWKEMYAGLGYRYYDYEEDEDDYADYDATIITFKLGTKF